MATSFGTRKALGRRYSQDPALLLEAERLQQEYGLMPGREARAMQAAQFQQSLAQQQAALAQQQSQFDTQQQNAESAGKWGTAANLATTGALIRGYTKAPGEPFFGQTLTGYYDKMMGNTPSVATTPTPTVAGYQYPANTTGQNMAAGAAGGAGGAYLGAPAPVADTLAGGGAVYGNASVYPGMQGAYSVTPAMMDTSGMGVGIGGMGGGGAAVPEAAAGMSPFAAYGGPAVAGYAGPKLADYAMKDFNENLGHTLTGGLVGDQGTAKAIGSGATGAAAGALTGAAIGAFGGPIGAGAGAIIGGAIGAISSIFGW